LKNEDATILLEKWKVLGLFFCVLFFFLTDDQFTI
jgi:hypothetical protein